MLRSGKVRYKPFRCGVMSVLLAIVLMLSGCSSFEGVTASGSSEAMPIEDGTADQLAGQEMNTLQNPLPSAAEVIAEAYSEAGTSEGEVDISGQMTGVENGPIGGGTVAGGDASSVGQAVAGTNYPISGSGADAASSAGQDILDAPVIPESEQVVQEIVAKPAKRKGSLPEVYDPNPAYDRYALVEYTIDDIGADFTATVSAKDDGSEYEVHCTMGKIEQIVILDADYSVTYDRTGRMGDDAPLIVQKAVEENDWTKIGE